MKDRISKLMFQARRLIWYLESRQVLEVDALRKIVDENKNDKNALKSIIRDLSEWVRGDVKGRLFVEELFGGEGIVKEVDDILKHGITNDDDYYCLISYLDEFYDDNNVRKIDLVNKLILEYEDKRIN